jgi:hypothetical protein
MISILKTGQSFFSPPQEHIVTFKDTTVSHIYTKDERLEIEFKK